MLMSARFNVLAAAAAFHIVLVQASPLHAGAPAQKLDDVKGSGSASSAGQERCPRP